MAISVCRVQSCKDLLLLEELRRVNVGEKFSDIQNTKESRSITERSTEDCQQLSSQSSSVIAKDENGRGIGYILFVAKALVAELPKTSNMFELICPIQYRGSDLVNTNFVFIDQVYVAEGYDSLVVKEKMYKHSRECLCPEFGYAVMTIESSDQLSVDMLLKVGFEVTNIAQYKGNELTVLVWDWNHGVSVGRVWSHEDVEMIKALQTANLGRNLSDEVKVKEGFVTAEYTIEFLQRMNSICPSIVARSAEGQIVGYIMVVSRELCMEHSLLTDLYHAFASIEYNGKRLEDTNLVVVGQVCVAAGYRGQGLVHRMYSYYKHCLSSDFDCAVTDVATSNPRSMAAHLKSGFRIIRTIPYDGLEWHIILWDWTAVKE
ncbi:GNAT family N-acetyltransferase [archaeon]|nr:MAG: GNAT family N-acetyltransferase [archaeon]